jgi:hypothetical protein
MCSPVGHALAALGVGAARGNVVITPSYIAFCLFSGIAADLDFLVGWYLGNINGYHHLGSHSLVAAGSYGLVAGILCTFWFGNGYRARVWGVTGGLGYLSHIILDMLSRDESDPVGLQLFWPFSETFYALPVFVFPKFLHEAEGSDMTGLIIGLFNSHNLFTIMIELVLFLPVTVYLLRRSNRNNIEHEKNQDRNTK